MLQAKETCHITGAPRLILKMKVWSSALFRYALPSTFVALELIVVLDLLGITSVLTQFLVSTPG